MDETRESPRLGSGVLRNPSGTPKTHGLHTRVTYTFVKMFYIHPEQSWNCGAYCGAVGLLVPETKVLPSWSPPPVPCRPERASCTMSVGTPGVAAASTPRPTGRVPGSGPHSPRKRRTLLFLQHKALPPATQNT